MFVARDSSLNLKFTTNFNLDNLFDLNVRSFVSDSILGTFSKIIVAFYAAYGYTEATSRSHGIKFSTKLFNIV